MRVLHYLPRVDLAEGGVVRAVLDLASLLSARGMSITLATYDDRDIPSSWREGAGGVAPAGSGVPSVVRLEAPSGPLGLFSKAQSARAGELVAGHDAVHLHTPWERPNLQFARWARRHGVPYVVSVHGMLDDWSMAQRGAKKRLYLSLAGRKMLAQASAVHATAEGEKAQAQRWLGGARCVVIPLVFDLSEYRDLPGPGPARERWALALARGPRVLFLSRIHEKKGLDVLIDACAELKRRGREVTLVVAGTGDGSYERQMREHAHRAGVGERTHFLGLVTGRDKVSLYQACDLFALPTSQENFGFVFCESLACGTAVVTTRGVDLWPDLEGAGAALIVERSAGAFADAIGSLLDDGPRREAMAEAGRRWVLRELDAGKLTERFAALYRGGGSGG